MASTEIDRDAAAGSPNTSSTPRGVDLKLEIVVIPVRMSTAPRRSTRASAGDWMPILPGDEWRVIQFTPPGPACSVIFGKNVTPAAPGSRAGCT